jgi:hypothetical protein
MVENHRQQEADADQHSAYYHTSLHVLPSLAKAAGFGFV